MREFPLTIKFAPFRFDFFPPITQKRKREKIQIREILICEKRKKKKKKKGRNIERWSTRPQHRTGEHPHSSPK